MVTNEIADVEEDFKIMGICNWKRVADRRKLLAIIQEAKTCRAVIPEEEGDIL